MTPWFDFFTLAYHIRLLITYSLMLSYLAPFDPIQFSPILSDATQPDPIRANPSRSGIVYTTVYIGNYHRETLTGTTERPWLREQDR